MKLVCQGPNLSRRALASRDSTRRLEHILVTLARSKMTEGLGEFIPPETNPEEPASAWDPIEGRVSKPEIIDRDKTGNTCDISAHR